MLCSENTTNEDNDCSTVSTNYYLDCMILRVKNSIEFANVLSNLDFKLLRYSC